MAGLKAPFPWYGGKSRSADLIWSMLGDPKVYAEPFAGSLAALLRRPPTAHRRPREMVVDIDHHIVNFWRAVKHDPDAVAHHCDHPTFHADLTARHTWLREWGELHRKCVLDDPEYYDARAAGWWVWGISLWIGGGWCQVSYDRRPMVQATGGGRGVSAIGQMPHVHGNPTGGAGVRSWERRDALVGHMAELAERLRDVIVLGGNWRQCLGPTPLMHTPTSPKPSVGILLDPPYLTGDRSDDIYGSDLDGTSDRVAIEAWEWALEHGDTYRIAYCCHDGDFDAPEGWLKRTDTFSGVRDRKSNAKRDCVLFSPACADASMPLFAGAA